MIRNLVLDWSGTLVNDLPAVLAATNYVMRKGGHPEFTLEQFRTEFSLPFPEFYARKLGDVDMEQMVRWFLEHFPKVQDQVTALPHAADFLDFARGCGLRLLLLSTIHSEHFEYQAEKLGFRDCFESCYTGVWNKKEIVTDLMTRHDLCPDETLFVGDMGHDMEAAREAGAIACAVLTGYSPLHQLRATSPDVIVENLAELQSLLQANGFNFPFRNRSPLLPAAGPVATVGALVFNAAGYVLLIRTQKWSDRWGIPGGKIKYNETAEAALRREMREETGLEIEEIQFVMIQDCIQSAEFYREAHFLLLNYTCRARDGDEVELNEEAQAYCWLPTAEALGMDLNEPTRILLEEVMRANPVHPG